jgi:hypothetical protein
MSRIWRWLAVVGICLIASPALTEQQVKKGPKGPVLVDKKLATFFVENTGAIGMPFCVPLNVPEEFANLTNVTVRPGTYETGKSFSRAQLTPPGMLTQEKLPAVKGTVRRDLHFLLPASEAKELSLMVSNIGFGNLNDPGYAWQVKPGEYAELIHNGKPVTRYICKPYDNSTPANRDKTYKVFHHLYDSAGKRFLTNGGDTNDPLPKNPKDNLYPHHRGLMYAFNKITFDDNKKCDTWHAQPPDTHESHEGFLSSEAGPVLGRHRVAVDWHGPDKKVFAKEEREVTVYKLDKGTLVEFASRLKTTGGLVKLQGDPQHAGFQFRAHNDVHEQKNDKQTYYLRPDGKGALDDTRNWDKDNKPKQNHLTVNLPWDAMCFVIDGKRYTAAYLNNPSNPGESRWSERDYGRFGCYFEYDLTEERPLVVNYRVWLQDGEMTGDQVEALYKAFVNPPKVTVK